ncbi:MAG TPA: FAD-dependent oxidoreductase, partial [Candidatus Dojkabacteria bacterium]|nr:FAD-dependent oxidoreductase [Candidatus Dojkabacteria bacterium]
IIGSQLSGDFVLPENQDIKCVFIAGGIGITPFRSMIKYLLDTKQKRDITLLYSDKTPKSFVYREIFDEAKKQLGFKIIYTATDVNSISDNWDGCTGRITPELIKATLGNYGEHKFYISGSQSMVNGVKKMLKEIKVKEENIITDYFPGLN